MKLQIIRALKIWLTMLIVVAADFSGFASTEIPPIKISSGSSCLVYGGPPVIPATLDNFPRVAGVTLYQATVSIIFEPGFTSEDGANFVAEIVPGTFGVPQATNLTGTANADMNWIQSTSYDENGAIIGENKQFFDDNGRGIQTQSKVFYRASPTTTYTHVLASQTIRDAYGRDAVNTMPAPIDYADFSYRPNFLQNSTSGSVYSHQNFDLSTSGDKTNNPDPLWDESAGAPAQGTLAWYYSRYNSWEPYTPETPYPYTRQTWYQDGTGNNKKKAGAGTVLKMGSGREGSAFVVPVANELDFYLQVRNKYFATTDLGALPSSLTGQAMQSIAHDPNGVETTTIQDKAGNTLMTARSGSGLTVSNSATISGSGSDMNIYYFKLLAAGAVSIGGGTFTLYDMNTEQAIGFSSGNTLPAGYYKVVNTGTTDLTLSYGNSYSDITYFFYNQKGQAVATITPEGVRKLYTNGLSAYATRASLPFINLFSYDLRGNLVSAQDPDGGIRTYVYRADGLLRFSQTAVQAASGGFSYTNYDQWSRPVEAGQYQPDAGGITYGSAAMNGILEDISPTGGLTTGTKSDVTVIQYETPDNSHGLAYTQDAANLATSISVTRKYSTIVNNSPSSTNLVSANWFNYDEEGKIVWTIKYINGLGYKTTDFTYDVLGNLTKQVFQVGTPAETFVHYYDYDPVSKQLLHVYTNTTDNLSTKMLQASYIYYLQGGLKRVELAGNLQGIDYTYTLQGGLKSINNSNKAQDPGNDGAANGFAPDAFGEVLDYYTGDYTNGKAGISLISGVDASTITTDKFNGLIKAMTWYSEKPTSTGLTDAPTTYVYQYDSKNQFLESTWGTGINFGAAPAPFTATAFNKEKIRNPSDNSPAYDANGNIQYLQRTDGSGAVTDQFAYQYGNGNNQLTSIMNTATSQTYASFTYDAKGQVIGENTGDANQKYMAYDVTGKVISVYRDAQHTLAASFVYDETGSRIKKLSYNTSGQLIQVTYYVDGVIYTQAVTNGGTTFAAASNVEYPLLGNGKLGTYYPQGSVYAYEMTDHLGNIRAVIAKNAGTYDVRMYSDYYPYGMVISSGGSGYRYGYQGQYSEKDAETGLNSFELRMYDGRIARWLQFDPKAQFYSPYIGMGNDPVGSVDPDGGSTDDWVKYIDPSDNHTKVVFNSSVTTTAQAQAIYGNSAEDIGSFTTWQSNENGTQNWWLFSDGSFREMQSTINPSEVHNLVDPNTAGTNTPSSPEHNFSQYDNWSGIAGNSVGIYNTALTGGQLAIAGKLPKWAGGASWWLAKNSKYYSQAFNGNGWVGGKNAALALEGKLGYVTKRLGFLGAGISAGQVINDVIHKNYKAATIHTLDTIMGVVGAVGGPIGGVVSGVYFVSRIFWGNDY